METEQVFKGFEILKSSKQLPVRSKSTEATNELPAIGFAWGKSDAVWLAPDPQPATPSFLLDPPSKSSTALPMEMDQNALMEMPNELKRLVSSSFDVFMRICHQMEAIRRQMSHGADQTNGFGHDAGHGAASVAIVQASRKYRAALQKCIFEMEDRLEKQQAVLVADIAASHNSTQQQDTEEFVDLLKVSLAVWHLCEILFFHRRPKEDKSLSYEVAQWLQEHYAGAKFDELEATSSRLKAVAVPEEDPSYWTTIMSFVLMGCGKNAWSLLSFHSANRSASFLRPSANSSSSSSNNSIRAALQAIQQLLVGMPGKSLVELRGMSFSNDLAVMNGGTFSDWRTWHEAASDLLRSNEIVQKDANLRKLVELLVDQDDDVLVSHCCSWYELMMAQLFLKKPKQVAHRFEFLMASCFHTLQQDMSNFDCIIMALFEYDVQSAIRDIHGIGFGWMAAHLCDLLTKASIIEDVISSSLECSLREYFLLNYAIEMGGCEGFWQMQMGYFGQCPRFGFSAICSLLAREHVTTDQKAHRLLACCRQLKLELVSKLSSNTARSRHRRLKTVEESIAIRRATECVHKKAYGMSLWWLLEANQLDHVDEVCELILRDCDQSEDLTFLHEAVEFLDVYHPEEIPRKLDWLVKYRELQLVLEDMNSLKQMLSKDVDTSNEEAHVALPNRLRFVRKEASKRLASLINSNATVPKRLRGKLLEQAAGLLQDKPCMFTSQELMHVVAFVKQIQRGFDRKTLDQNPTFTNYSRTIERLVARNLAEAFIGEALTSTDKQEQELLGGSRDGVFARCLVATTDLNGNGTSAMDIDDDDVEFLTR